MEVNNEQIICKSRKHSYGRSYDIVNCSRYGLYVYRLKVKPVMQPGNCITGFLHVNQNT